MTAPPRFFCAPVNAPERIFALPPKVAHHAVHVLRLTVGEPLTLFDGTGGEYPAQIVTLNRGKVEVRLGQHCPIERESPLSIHLAQTLQSGEKMDYTLQKAVELGVTAFLPLTGRRSVSRLDKERAEKRRARWQEIAISACEQCGRNRIPEIKPIIPLENWLREMGKKGEKLPGLKLLLLPDAKPRFSTLKRPAPDTPITLLIGAEGGFDPLEIEAAHAAGFCPVQLGSRTLRTETASLAALAILQGLWGDA
ncbi:MAG: 16S rRNA (uracil(1498)-N(3))-methyltransferase [Zoogloeaceae bacterium]|jgi:16S rRNA (uracil1498-N3)-methyltransferase|nr:16S rRNA (uracil(1498)-N(3))-methyltransferase [Zoogloeaceae bacterium]